MGTLALVGSLPVPVPPERAWELWSRVEDWPRWDWLGSADARWLEGEPWTAGARLRVGHRPGTFDCVVVSARPADSWRFEGAAPGSTAATRSGSCPTRPAAWCRRPRSSRGAAPVP
mgnify:CR=1 FL=1